MWSAGCPTCLPSNIVTSGRAVHARSGMNRCSTLARGKRFPIQSSRHHGACLAAQINDIGDARFPACFDLRLSPDGAAEFVTKPVDFDFLKERLRQLHAPLA